MHDNTDAEIEQTNPEEPKRIGTHETAKLLCVSPATVLRAADSGAIPVAAVTPGGHRRFDRETILGIRQRLSGGLGPYRDKMVHESNYSNKSKEGNTK